MPISCLDLTLRLWLSLWLRSKPCGGPKALPDMGSPRPKSLSALDLQQSRRNMNIPANIWHQVFDNAHGYCEYCGEDLLISRAAYASAQVDHVQARAKGGGNEIENLRLACSLCNSSLSRYNRLASFEERKSHIQNQLGIHKRNYLEKYSRLRQVVAKD